MVRRVCLVSGGTGGHLLPALTLAEALRARGCQPLVVTAGRAAERALLDGRDLPARELPVAGGFGLPLHLARAVLQGRTFLRGEQVDLVIGTGGRTTVPMALAARSLGLPVCLLEQNAVPGRANRLLAPLAQRVYCGLPTARRLPRALVTGTPLRPDLGRIDRREARARLSLDPDAAVLLVTGGSQGAAVLNNVVPAALAGVRPPLQVIHLAGSGNDAAVRLAYGAVLEELRVVVRAVSQDMATLYAAADLVICRGGGATVAELMAVGRAAIVVPYPHHRDRQQWHNGAVLARAGAAVVIEQTELDAEALRAELTARLADVDALRAMGDRARALLPGDACARIVDDLERLNGFT